MRRRSPRYKTRWDDLLTVL
ncbi:MAG: DUF4113 domain-containing protein [Leptolyngbya sp. SIOISBB]|nr:DUF4113 domain-containing protein [Leptolyngbya sp. SIOISBB]